MIGALLSVIGWIAISPILVAILLVTALAGGVSTIFSAIKKTITRSVKGIKNFFSPSSEKGYSEERYRRRYDRY